MGEGLWVLPVTTSRAFIIHGKSLEDVLVESLCRSLAEAVTYDGMNEIANGIDDIEIRTIGRFGRKIGISDFSYMLNTRKRSRKGTSILLWDT